MSENVYGLGDQLRGVAALEVDGKLTRVDAHYIDEITDEPIHARDVAFNALRCGDGSRVGFGCLLRQKRRVPGDAAQKIAQIVTDDAQKVIAVRERVVGPGALGQEVAVGFFPLQR